MRLSRLRLASVTIELISGLSKGGLQEGEFFGNKYFLFKSSLTSFFMPVFKMGSHLSDKWLIISSPHTGASIWSFPRACKNSASMLSSEGATSQDGTSLGGSSHGRTSVSGASCSADGNCGSRIFSSSFSANAK